MVGVVGVGVGVVVVVVVVVVDVVVVVVVVGVEGGSRSRRNNSSSSSRSSKSSSCSGVAAAVARVGYRQPHSRGRGSLWGVHSFSSGSDIDGAPTRAWHGCVTRIDCEENIIRRRCSLDLLQTQRAPRMQRACNISRAPRLFALHLPGAPGIRQSGLEFKTARKQTVQSSEPEGAHSCYRVAGPGSVEPTQTNTDQKGGLGALRGLRKPSSCSLRATRGDAWHCPPSCGTACAAGMTREPVLGKSGSCRPSRTGR